MTEINRRIRLSDGTEIDDPEDNITPAPDISGLQNQPTSVNLSNRSRRAEALADTPTLPRSLQSIIDEEADRTQQPNALSADPNLVGPPAPRLTGADRRRIAGERGDQARGAARQQGRIERGQEDPDDLRGRDRADREEREQELESARQEREQEEQTQRTVNDIANNQKEINQFSRDITEEIENEEIQVPNISGAVQAARPDGGTSGSQTNQRTVVQSVPQQNPKPAQTQKITTRELRSQTGGILGRRDTFNAKRSAAILKTGTAEERANVIINDAVRKELRRDSIGRDVLEQFDEVQDFFVRDLEQLSQDQSIKDFTQFKQKAQDLPTFDPRFTGQLNVITNANTPARFQDQTRADRSTRNLLVNSGLVTEEELDLDSRKTLSDDDPDQFRQKVAREKIKRAKALVGFVTVTREETFQKGKLVSRAKEIHVRPDKEMLRLGQEFQKGTLPGFDIGLGAAEFTRQSSQNASIPTDQFFVARDLQSLKRKARSDNEKTAKKAQENLEVIGEELKILSQKIGMPPKLAEVYVNEVVTPKEDIETQNNDIKDSIQKWLNKVRPDGNEPVISEQFPENVQAEFERFKNNIISLLQEEGIDPVLAVKEALGQANENLDDGEETIFAAAMNAIQLSKGQLVRDAYQSAVSRRQALAAEMESAGNERAEAIMAFSLRAKDNQFFDFILTDYLRDATFKKIGTIPRKDIDISTFPDQTKEFLKQFGHREILRTLASQADKVKKQEPLLTEYWKGLLQEYDNAPGRFVVTRPQTHQLLETISERTFNFVTKFEESQAQLAAELKSAQVNNPGSHPVIYGGDAVNPNSRIVPLPDAETAEEFRQSGPERQQEIVIAAENEAKLKEDIANQRRKLRKDALSEEALLDTANFMIKAIEFKVGPGGKVIRTEKHRPAESELDWERYGQSLVEKYASDPETYQKLKVKFDRAHNAWSRKLIDQLGWNASNREREGLAALITDFEFTRDQFQDNLSNVITELGITATDDQIKELTDRFIPKTARSEVGKGPGTLDQPVTTADELPSLERRIVNDPVRAFQQEISTLLDEGFGSLQEQLNEFKTLFQEKNENRTSQNQE